MGSLPRSIFHAKKLFLFDGKGSHHLEQILLGIADTKFITNIGKIPTILYFKRGFLVICGGKREWRIED